MKIKSVFAALFAAIGICAAALAVYIGAKQFSARRNADNFDDNDIIETVRYCHIRGVKVYLALNIMIKQSLHSLVHRICVCRFNMHFIIPREDILQGTEWILQHFRA